VFNPFEYYLNTGIELIRYRVIDGYTDRLAQKKGLLPPILILLATLYIAYRTAWNQIAVSIRMVYFKIIMRMIIGHFYEA
jgi:hypothetical protein